MSRGKGEQRAPGCTGTPSGSLPCSQATPSGHRSCGAPMGKIGARSSAVSGCRVLGLSGGAGGAGRSGMMLYLRGCGWREGRNSGAFLLASWHVPHVQGGHCRGRGTTTGNLALRPMPSSHPCGHAPLSGDLVLIQYELCAVAIGAGRVAAGAHGSSPPPGAPSLLLRGQAAAAVVASRGGMQPAHRTQNEMPKVSHRCAVKGCCRPKRL